MDVARKSITSEVICTVCLDAPATGPRHNLAMLKSHRFSRYGIRGSDVQASKGPREDKHIALDGFARPGWPWHDFEMND